MADRRREMNSPAVSSARPRAGNGAPDRKRVRKRYRNPWTQFAIGELVTGLTEGLAGHWENDRRRSRFAARPRGGREGGDDSDRLLGETQTERERRPNRTIPGPARARVYVNDRIGIESGRT